MTEYLLSEIESKRLETERQINLLLSEFEKYCGVGIVEVDSDYTTSHSLGGSVKRMNTIKLTVFLGGE